VTETKEKIIDYIKHYPTSSSKEIYDGSGAGMSYATLKRVLQTLIAENLVIAKGRGRGTKYEIDPSYDLVRPVDMDQYFEREIDEREIRRNFNQSLIRETLQRHTLFTKTELVHLDHLQALYKINSQKLSPAAFNKELERLAIDLSWKSSQIEGNTYSLLETERLLKEQQTARGKTKDEATMLLNHKAALDFIIAHPDYIEPLTIPAIEDIHHLLTGSLQVARNIRSHRVGISGTNYQPPDNEFQLREAMEDMCVAINSRENVFTKSLLALMLLSYIQPFVDGNKRTARIISNGIRIKNNYCPVSFRTADPGEYKKAMLVFYEQNNISPFKKIFMEQFEFAVNTYF
jgi:fido (protein-threonine AMPylation protein)